MISRGKKIGWLVTVAGVLAVIGCTLTTPLDGLSDGERPDSGSPDASMDAPHDAPHDAPDDGPDAGCTGDYAAAVLADSPVVFYPLDDDGPVAFDRSGHGLDGTYGDKVLTHAPSSMPDGCGFAAGFPGGAGDYPKSVQTPRDAELEPKGGVTMEAWIKISTLPSPNGDNNPAIVAYGDDGAKGVVYTMDIFGPGATLNTYVTTALTPGYVGIHGTTKLEVDRVYYVVATYDGETIALYLDGMPEAHQNVSPGGGAIVGYTSNGLFLGDDPPFTARPAFAGTIENVAIYAKALSKSRIAAHYQAAKP